MVLVSEPEDDDTTTSISLTVERTGGDTGVVEVSWTLSSNNGEMKHIQYSLFMLREELCLATYI